MTISIAIFRFCATLKHSCRTSCKQVGCELDSHASSYIASLLGTQSLGLELRVGCEL